MHPSSYLPLTGFGNCILQVVDVEQTDRGIEQLLRCTRSRILSRSVPSIWTPSTLCRALAVKLACKRPLPLLRGDRRIWAAGIVHTIGWVNFLADPAQTPHLRIERLAELLDVKQTTMGNKGALIRDLFGIGRFHQEFVRQDMIEKNLMAWLVDVDGRRCGNA